MSNPTGRPNPPELPPFDQEIRGVLRQERLLLLKALLVLAGIGLLVLVRWLILS